MQKEFNKIKPYVYWIKNNITGIKYFGVRWGNITKNVAPVQDLGKKYFTSGKLKKDFEKNPDNFRIKLIATFDTVKEAQEYEVKQNKKIIKNKRYANISAYPTLIFTPEIRRKISEFRKGRKFSGKRKGLVGKAKIKMRGREKSEETKRKIGLAHKGIKFLVREGTSDEKTFDEVIVNDTYQKKRFKNQHG